MSAEFINELQSKLQTSDARLRKYWANRMVEEQIPLSSLMMLLHAPGRTAQRFTWFIGDLLDRDRDIVRECLPMLFALRDEMPFPGMRRSVAKCLWYLGIPEELEEEATAELFKWLKDDKYAVGVKHYASKALYDLAIEGRVDAKRLDRILKRQTQHETVAHAARMEKLRLKLKKQLTV